jgi:hypothetical protein
MPVALVQLGALEGVQVHHAPVGGVIWDRGALLRLDDAEVTWRMPVADPPVLALAGRRLYVGTEGWVLCYDVRFGDEAWAVDCGAPIVALDAHPGGVDVLAGARVLAFDPRGEAGPIVSVDPGAMHLRRVGAKRYIATPAGVYRLVAEERPALLYACRARALHVREGGLHALVEGPPGTVLAEDDGLAMVWPFPDATTHLLAPWGRDEWAITPLTGRGGLWVVDRRVLTRWQVPLPGRLLALAVAGAAVAVAVEDGGHALALIHPDVSTPLLLAIDGVDTLHAEGPRLNLTHAGRTVIFHVRDTT